MAIGIVDYDFFHNAPSIPNLECGKLIAYWRSHNEYTTLLRDINLERYRQVYFRQDFSNVHLPSELSNKKVLYGGRFFSPAAYQPLPLEIEETPPIFENYESYSGMFAAGIGEQQTFSKILRAIHLRLSLDGKTVWPQFEKQISKKDNRRAIYVFHDYDLGQIDGAREVIAQLVEKEWGAGMKFPVCLSDEKELFEWGKIPLSNGLANFHFNGVLSDEGIAELVCAPPSFLTSLSYVIVPSWFGENQFLEEVFPEIYNQVLFLRSQRQKILLKIEPDFGLGPLFQMIGRWIRASFSCTLFEYITFLKGKKKISAAELNALRENFQYIRENNYALFSLFYSARSASLKGGKFEPTGNSETN